ncbi:MAG: c-type cytochrome, partial [Gaiellaceae bacterium]
CHTLAAAGSDGTTGPNLDDLMPDEETVEAQVRSGGGGMPAFEGQLSDAEIEAVATYVSESAGS